MTFNPSFTAVQNYTEYDLGEGVFYRMVTFPTLTDCIISDNTKEWDGDTVLIDGVGPKHISEIGDLQLHDQNVNITIVLQNKKPRTFTITWDNSTVDYLAGFKLEQKLTEASYGVGIEPWKIILPTGANIVAKDNTKMFASRYMVDEGNGTRRPVAEAMLKNQNNTQRYKSNLTITPLLVNKPTPITYSVNFSEIDGIVFRPPFIKNQSVTELVAGQGISLQQVTFPTMSNITFPVGKTWDGRSITVNSVQYDINNLPTTKFKTILNIRLTITNIPPRTLTATFENGAGYTFKSSFNRVQSNLEDTYMGEIPFARLDLPTIADIDLASTHEWDGNTFLVSTVGTRTRTQLGGMSFGQDCRISLVTTPKAAPRSFNVNWDRTESEYNPGFMFNHNIAETSHGAGFMGSLIAYPSSITHKTNNEMEFSGNINVQGNTVKLLNVTYDSIKTTKFEENLLITPIFRRKAKRIKIEFTDNSGMFNYPSEFTKVQEYVADNGTSVSGSKIVLPGSVNIINSKAVELVTPRKWIVNDGATSVEKTDAELASMTLTRNITIYPVTQYKTFTVSWVGHFDYGLWQTVRNVVATDLRGFNGSAIEICQSIENPNSNLEYTNPPVWIIGANDQTQDIAQGDLGNHWFDTNITIEHKMQPKVEVSPPRPAVYSDFVMPATAVESDYEIDGEGTMTLKARNADWKKDRPILKDQIRSFQYEVARGDQFFNLTADDTYNSLSLVRLAGTKNYGTVVGQTVANRTSSGPFDTVAPGFGAYLAGIGDTVTGFIDNKGKLTMFIKKVGTSEHKKWFSTTIAKLKIQYPTFTYSDIFRVGWWNGISSSEGGSIKELFKKLRVSTSWEAFNPEINYNQSEEPESRTLDPSKKYAVFAILGQSNAVGYDESPVVASDYPADPRMWTLGYREHNMELVPTNWHTMTWQDMRQYANPAGLGGTLAGTKSVGYPLGKLLLQDLPPDYELVLVSVAYGSTSVGSGGNVSTGTLVPTGGNTWGPSGSLYMTAKRRIEAVLNANPENKFIGAMYLQGESDINNTAGWRTHYSGMYNDFNNWLQSKVNTRPTLLTGTAPANSRWFFVESCSYWKSLANYQQLLSRAQDIHNGTDTYVAIPDDPNDTNNVNGTGRTSSNRLSHFGNNAYTRVVAPAIYAKLKATNAI